MMRRNDFQAIADIIRTYHTNGTVDKLVLRDMADKMSGYFRQSNPTFDKGRFVRACGWYDE
jgi:hypothetical protein